MNRKASTLTAAMLVAAAAALAMTGCASPADQQLRYKAEVQNGTIAEVRYTYIDGPNGSVSMPATPGTSGWHEELNGGHSPRLVVTPSPGGTASCELTSVGTDSRALVSQTRQAGKAVPRGLPRKQERAPVAGAGWVEPRSFS